MDLDKARQQLRSLWPWWGPRQRRRAVLDLLKDGLPPAIAVLAQEAAGPENAAGEILVLLRRRARRSPAARETLCQLVIQYDHPLARNLTLAAGCSPQDPQLRALFFFLTEQWESYDTLDFDGHLLRNAYTALAPSVRERVAALARRVGRVGWVEVAAGGQQGRRLAEMSDVEWKSALLLLYQSRRYDELWQLAQTAPLLWCARSLELLRRAKWPPPQSPYYDALTEIANLAARCEDEPPSWGDAVEVQQRIIAHSGKALALAVSPDGKTLFSGGSDGVVRLWELPSGRELGVFKGAGGPITTLSLASDGQFLAAGDMDGRLYLWDVAGRRHVAAVEAHDSPVTALRVTPDGRFLLSGAQNSMAFGWSLPDLNHIAQYTTSFGSTGTVAKFALSPDGEWAACSQSYGAFVHVWRLPAGDDMHLLPGCNDAGIAFSHDGSLLASSTSAALTESVVDIALWRVGSWACMGALRKHNDIVLSLRWTPDDRVLISGGRDNCIHLWNMPSGKHRQELYRHVADVSRLALDVSGQFLLSGGLFPSARLWNVTRGELLTPLQGYQNVISDFLLAPQTRTLATSDWDGKVVLWQFGPALLRAAPLSHLELRDIEWIEAMLARESARHDGAAWLRFALALLHWRHRFDIEVEDAPHRIEVGEFDIEIAG